MENSLNMESGLKYTLALKDVSRYTMVSQQYCIISLFVNKYIYLAMDRAKWKYIHSIKWLILPITNNTFQLAITSYAHICKHKIYIVYFTVSSCLHVSKNVFMNSCLERIAIKGPVLRKHICESICRFRLKTDVCILANHLANKRYVLNFEHFILHIEYMLSIKVKSSSIAYKSL